jgi:hypothetical protein
MPHHSLSQRITHCFIAIFLFSSLLAACSSSSIRSGPGNTPQVSRSSPTVPPTPTPITQPVPPTQTDCPPTQTGRALVTAPLAQGKNPQVVYVPNGSPDYGQRLVRYDTVTHTTTDIVKVPENTIIKSIITSRNDPWVFFFTGANVHASPAPGGTLQAVRIDGQGLQTLYCNLPAIAPLVSPDHHYLAFGDFAQYPEAPDTIHLFDTTSGKIFDKIKIPTQSTQPYDDPVPYQWLSNTQLYLRDKSNPRLRDVPAPYISASNIYLLDTTSADNQPLSSLQAVTTQSNTSITTDGSSLYMSQQQCQDQAKIACSSGTLVKSTISHLATQGGDAQQIYENAQLAIDTITMIDSQSLLVSGSNPSVNTYEIWTVNTDGSNAKRIASTPLLVNSDYPNVGNISGDHTQFLVSNWHTDAGKETQMYIGSVQDSTLTPLHPNTANLYFNNTGWAML